MLVNFIIFINIQIFWFTAGYGLKKVIFVLFQKVDKVLNVSEKTINQNTSFTISFKRTMYSTFIFVKTLADLSALWC